MDQAVYETLLRVTDSDGGIRSAAEQRLKEFAAAPEYPVSLTRLTVSRDIAVPQRQLAALTLKTYLQTHWSARSEETFVGPEPPAESKAAVRELIVHGLADPESKIRVVCAYVVSRIAHDDFPEDWHNLLDILLSYLKSNSADSVHGAMRVLSEMVSRDISIQQLPQIGPVLIPELFTILTNDTVYSFRTRGRAVNIFNSCIQMLSTLREEQNATFGDQFIAPLMPQWLQAFHTILRHHVQNDPEKATEEYGLKMEVVKCICNLSAEFPKLIVASLPEILEPIWMELQALKDRYVAESVSESADAAETFQDSDGNEIGSQNLLYALFDFIIASCSKKSVRHLYVVDRAPTAFFQELVYVLIAYMQITQEQAETWSSDANQYVADEEDATFSFNARVAATDVVFELQDTFENAFYKALQSALQRHISESNSMRAAGNPEWWKIQEACLLAISRGDLPEAIKGARNIDFDVSSLFDHVVLESMKAEQYPFLQGRAFVFASEFANVLPAEMASQYVSVAVNALQAPSSGIPVKISALRSLKNYCKFVDPQHVAPHQVSIMEATCQLLNEASEESLILLLEALGAAVRINTENAANYEQVLTPAVLGIWKKFCSDPIIASFVLDIVEDFAKSPNYFTPLYQRTLPFLDQVFKSQVEEPVVLANAIDLLTAMIRYGPSPLPKEFTDQEFGVLMQVAWNSTDDEVLQSAQECVKNYVTKDCDHLIEWRDPAGKSGLDYVVHFVAKLLEPSGSDSEAFFVGDLILTIIKKAGNMVASILPQVLRAVLARLDSTSYGPFLQSLVMVFAHLVIHQQETVFQFLCETEINNQRGLDILMHKWCDFYDSFAGYYTQRVSAVALSKMFLISDPRLQSITVRGSIVVNPSGGIVTRSKAKQNPEQYTALPVHAKILELLVGELANAVPPPEQAQPLGGTSETESLNDDEDEDDWEDLDFGKKGDDVAFLSDMLAELDEDEERNNPELKNDPLFHLDLRAYLVDFFRNCSSQNVNHFMELCQQHLNETDKEVLEHALKQ